MENQVENLKPVTGGQLIDVSEFEGDKAAIEATEIMTVKSIYAQNGDRLPIGQFREVPVLKVSTGPIVSKVDEKGEKIEIRASQLFNLNFETKNGKIVPQGWNSKGKLGKLLAKYNVQHPKDLIGKNVVVKCRGDGFLGFYTN